MTNLPPLLGAIAAIAWLVAVVSSIAMVKHRAPGVGIFYLMSHGIAFFSADKFTERATPHRRRFVRAFLVFMFCVMGLAVTAALVNA